MTPPDLRGRYLNDLRPQKVSFPPQQIILEVAMGSLAIEADDGEKEINVLVTGFGVRHSP